MRHVVSLMHMSLDGFVAGPAGEMDWIHLDEQVFAYVARFVAAADTGLYGPTTFAMMEAHWPAVFKDSAARGHQRAHAQWYDRADKIVFSRTLDRLDHPRARLVRDDLPGAVARLQEAGGADLMIFGSPGLVQSFARLGLIDEYVVTISPVVIGAGIPLFAGIASRIDLQLVAATHFDIGTVGLHYMR